MEQDPQDRRVSPRTTYVYNVGIGHGAPEWSDVKDKVGKCTSLAMRFNEAKYHSTDYLSMLTEYDFDRFEEMAFVRPAHAFTKPYDLHLRVCVFLKRTDLVSVSDFERVKARWMKLFPPEGKMKETRVTIYVPNRVSDRVRAELRDRLLVHRNLETYVDLWDECPLTKETMVAPNGGFLFQFVHIL